MTTNVEPLKIGAVLFPGFELLDIYGPVELLGMVGAHVPISITMLAEKSGEVPSSQGPRGVADASLAEVSGLDILLVPGGIGTRKGLRNSHFLDLLRSRAQEARFVASICTGSALLAKAGLLEGKRATSNKLVFDWVSTLGTNVTWVREARWVEDGNVFTASGVSAGMDMTLGLIQRLYGREMSLEVARWAEYTWHEDSTLDPFAFPAPLKGEEG